MRGMTIKILNNTSLLSFDAKGDPKFDMSFSKSETENNVCYYNRSEDSIIQVNTNTTFRDILQNYTVSGLSKLFPKGYIIQIIKNIVHSDFSFHLTALDADVEDFLERTELESIGDFTDDEYIERFESEFPAISETLTSIIVRIGTANLYMYSNGSIRFVPHSGMNLTDKDYEPILSFLSEFIPDLKGFYGLEKVEMVQTKETTEKTK